MAQSRLHQLSELGQSVWIDSLSRDMLRSGELARLMKEDAVVGITSNPTIFQKAVAAGEVYDEQLRQELEHEHDPKELFSGPRWEALEARGATSQRCLWASTSTKNPAYRDVLYVEELIGPRTVNTMPEETIRAFQDHGRVALTLEQGLDEAKEVFSRIAEAGVDYDDVTATLEREGVEKFADSFAELLDGIRAKSGELVAT